MVCKWMVNNPLTLDERKKIKECIDLKMSYGKMSKVIGRAKSTLLHEVQRRGGFESYDPVEAQMDFENKQFIRMKHRRNLYDTCRIL